MTAATSFLAGVVLVGTVAALAIGSGNPEFPDPQLTPGELASTDVREVCASDGLPGSAYSRHHRHTTSEMKAAVRERYGTPPGWRGEIDHLVSLCLGGADSIKNLWPQSGTGRWNYHVKDRLEAYLCREVCSGKVDLMKAQQDMAHDWQEQYVRYLGQPEEWRGHGRAQ